MAKLIVSESQRTLFALLPACGELVFACGHDGINANIVGEFHIQSLPDEDRLVVGDGTQHVHIDWRRVRHAEVSEYNGEGLLTFLDGRTVLFKLYRLAGPYPEMVAAAAGTLVE